MKQRVALITGASSGIGRATARLFLSNGISVVAVGRSEAELNALHDEAEEHRTDLKIQLADVTVTSEMDRVVTETVDDFGQIDVLVNCAGIIKNGSIEDTALDDWDKMMDVNVRSVFYLMQKCVPHLEKVKGNIVTVSSVTGTRAFPGVLAYCVSKAAIDQLTRCAALELAPKGVRVNAVNPGVVVTNLHKRGGMAADKYDKFIEHAAETHPIGRAGQPEEIAELIYFLSSEKAGWITGVTYAIDGGRAETCAR